MDSTWTLAYGQESKVQFPSDARLRRDPKSVHCRQLWLGDSDFSNQTLRSQFKSWFLGMLHGLLKLNSTRTASNYALLARYMASPAMTEIL
jgi:hypothetical protein